ncbi:MAG: hypothetical protein K0S39_692 [Paenibacillus sp.]|jgi:two-component system response regulator YesN|nr:hypothetical protein [Paenibacillus sp.]
MKVLLVEDEILVRRFIKTLIDWEANGFSVAGEASNGEEAWEFLENQGADIVLTDIRMPVLNGFELIGRIRDKQLPCGVIILSSYDDFEYVRNALKFHVSDYVHKAAVSGSELLDSLKQAKRDWLSRHEQLLYDRPLSRHSLSRKGTVAANILTRTLERSTDQSYLKLLSESLMFWNEPFHVALADKSGSEAITEQGNGEIVMFPYGGHWIIAGKHAVKEFAAGQNPEAVTVYSENTVSLAEWPAIYETLKQELAELLQKQDQTSMLHVSIREAVAYIQEYFKDELTLEVISDHVHVSPAYFSRLFQKETGKTFTDYLTEIRINRAKSLLQRTALPVYDIAERVGYRNSRYFLKLFKETVGLTPTEFRDKKISK